MTETKPDEGLRGEVKALTGQLFEVEPQYLGGELCGYRLKEAEQEELTNQILAKSIPIIEEWERERIYQWLGNFEVKEQGYSGVSPAMAKYIKLEAITEAMQALKERELKEE